MMPQHGEVRAAWYEHGYHPPGSTNVFGIRVSESLLIVGTLMTIHGILKNSVKVLVWGCLDAAGWSGQMVHLRMPPLCLVFHQVKNYCLMKIGRPHSPDDKRGVGSAEKRRWNGPEHCSATTKKSGSNVDHAALAVTTKCNDLNQRRSKLPSTNSTGRAVDGASSLRTAAGPQTQEPLPQIQSLCSPLLRLQLLTIRAHPGFLSA